MIGNILKLTFRSNIGFDEKKLTSTHSSKYKKWSKTDQSSNNILPPSNQNWLDQRESWANQVLGICHAWNQVTLFFTLYLTDFPSSKETKRFCIEFWKSVINQNELRSLYELILSGWKDANAYLVIETCCCSKIIKYLISNP